MAVSYTHLDVYKRQVVQVGELGNFQLQFGSTGTLTEDEVNSALIKSKRILFRPGKQLRDAISNYTFEKIVPETPSLSLIHIYDTLTTTVGDKLVSVVAKDADITKDQVDGLKAFQFGICLADEDVEGEYIVYNGSKYVYALNGKFGLTYDTPTAMVFTLGDETPAANEGVEVSEVKVIAGEGNVMIAGAQGKKVVICLLYTASNFRNTVGSGPSLC